MRKVYLVELDSGEYGFYSDYDWWVEKVFSKYQSAYDWLWNQGYRNDEGDWIKEDEFGGELGATIEEMDVED